MINIKKGNQKVYLCAVKKKKSTKTEEETESQIKNLSDLQTRLNQFENVHEKETFIKKKHGEFMSYDRENNEEIEEMEKFLVNNSFANYYCLVVVSTKSAVSVDE